MNQSFISNNSSRQILELTRGKNGYGFTLTGQAPCFVSWIVEGSPAHEIGLAVGDSIVSVNGEDVSEASHETVVKSIGMSSGVLLLGVINQCSMQDRLSRSNYIRLSKNDNTARSKRSSLLVLMKSVVAYLGTVDIGKVKKDSIKESSFASAQRCVEALRLEQHIHQRVVLMVAQTCVRLQSADQNFVAFYSAEDIKYSDVYQHDHRFFYIVTYQKSCNNDGRFLNHIFLVDPDISSHSNHIDKAKRFGIQCSTSDNGVCVEFPSSPQGLVKLIQLLYLASQTSSSCNAEDISEPAFHVVDMSNQSNNSLTRGESSLPSVMRMTWSDTNERSNRSSRSSDDNFASYKSSSGLNGSSVRDSVTKLEKVDNRSGSASIGFCGLKAFREKRLSGSQIPPPMQKLSLQKYSVLTLSGSSASLGRSTTKKKHSSRINHGKRYARIFPSHVTSPHSVSKSFENVAASDDDIMSGASSVESLASNVSLPSCMNGSLAGLSPNQEAVSLRSSNSAIDEGAGRISHWAVSFDRMLEDPLGVKYFKEFLRKEFSEENILFWEACEQLRRSDADDINKLKESIQDIYNRFLSLDSEMAVNIDGHGQQLAEEALQAAPHPNIFSNQQQQVYTLMKLDSYSRFLKSNLYRQCMLCEMEGRPLPLEENGIDGRGASRSLDSDTLQRQTKKFKTSRKGIFNFKNRSKSQKFSGGNTLTRQSSGESTGSDNGTPLIRTASLPTNSIDMIDATKVCHVTLWDNSSTVLYARKQGRRTIGEALEDLCERRGTNLSSIDVFLIVEVKEKGIVTRLKRPLSISVDIAAVASQSIVIERRTTLRIDVKPAGKSLSVKAKSTKLVSDVLHPVLDKYNLKIQDLVIKTSVDNKLVQLNELVSTLDGQTVIADVKPGLHSGKERTRNSLNKSIKSEIPDKKDTEELIQLMSSLQSSKLHDQRGLLSKADLEMPEFLKVKATNNNNNNNNVSKNPINDSSNDRNYDSDSSSCLSSSERWIQAHAVASGRQRSKSGERKKQMFLELNTYPSSFTTFKPIQAINKAPSVGNLDCSVKEDIHDTTIIEEITLNNEPFDPDMTVVSFPTTPTSIRGISKVLSAHDHTLPTPLARK